MNQHQKAHLDNAIREDHPCSDDIGCDIEVARGNGFTEAAAIMLTGETPNVDRVIKQYNITLRGLHGPGFNRWYAWHTAITARNAPRASLSCTLSHPSAAPTACT